MTEFYNSHKNYGTRKLNIVLKPLSFVVSLKRISQIMKKLNLVSNHTIAHYKKYYSPVNSVPIKNVLNRQFNQKNPLEVVVTDLTFVRVGGKRASHLPNCRFI